MFQSIYDTMIAGQRYVLIFQGLGVTLLIAFCAIIIGTILGCILALMKISDNRILKGIGTLYTTVLRGLPLATQLMIFYFVVFAPLHLPKLLVAILAYGLNSGAYCTEIFRAGIQGVDMFIGTFQAADPVQDYPSAGCKGSASYLHQRIYRADQGDIGSQLHCSNGYDQGRRHDPQRNLQCVDSSFDLCHHLPYPDTGTYQGI